jgi:hypothetical protein
MASLIVLAHSSQPKCQQPTSCWLTRTCPLKDTEKEKIRKIRWPISLSLSLWVSEMMAPSRSVLLMEQTLTGPISRNRMSIQTQETGTRPIKARTSSLKTK